MSDDALVPFPGRQPFDMVSDLVVPEGVAEMITLFHVTGAYVCVDPYGAATGYEDVLTKIENARRHYAESGLGGERVEEFMR